MEENKMVRIDEPEWQIKERARRNGRNEESYLKEKVITDTEKVMKTLEEITENNSRLYDAGLKLGKNYQGRKNDN